MPPPNAFINHHGPPTDAELVTALGPAKAAWDRFLADLDRELGVNVCEWKCHSPKWGWSLRVLLKKRTIVWLSPALRCFNVLFILGERAMTAARCGKMPQRVVNILDTAPKYPEGTGVRFVVKGGAPLRTLMKLATIKLAN